MIFRKMFYVATIFPLRCCSIILKFIIIDEWRSTAVAVAADAFIAQRISIKTFSVGVMLMLATERFESIVQNRSHVLFFAIPSNA